jgi:hypothetical protein
MTEYVVYRHGWNDDNQSRDNGLPEKMAVARIEAGSPEDACRLAKARVTLHENQYLSAEPAEEVDARENNLNLRAEALENQQ